MLIYNEYVNSICEFVENQFLISVLPTDLLVVSGWTVLHTVVDPVPGNIEKFWLSPPPQFDLENFPFVVSSGQISFNLVNVKTGEMGVFIDGSPQNLLGQ